MHSALAGTSIILSIGILMPTGWMRFARVGDSDWALPRKVRGAGPMASRSCRTTIARARRTPRGIL